jgi:hypothetical protein
MLEVVSSPFGNSSRLIGYLHNRELACAIADVIGDQGRV